MKQGIGIAMLAAALMLCSGCMVETNKSSNGGENVKVVSPFGGLQVKADNSTHAADLGLPEYPGSVLVKDGDDKNSGSADINMGFGDFTFRVKVVSYGTDDSSDKVVAFYKKAMHQYGDVLECQNNKAVGKPEKTAEGLSCDDAHGHTNINNVNVDDGISLRTGSEHHQRIVAVDANGGGGKKTKFAMVELVLPKGTGNKDSN
jgi:hypothetical protein